MKNGAWIVFKKEISHFFGDKRLLFTSVIMPGLLIYILYSVLGMAMSSMMKDEVESFKAAALNMPQTIESSLSEYNFEIEHINADEAEKAKQKVSDGDYSLLVIFPDNFENFLSQYSGKSSADAVPNIEVYYVSADINSSQAYYNLISVLDKFEGSLSNVFDVNNAGDSDINYDLSTSQDLAGNLLGSMLPMLLMTLMYSSCASLAPESIAGEKERGTIYAMLITPVPRSRIIMGKLAALSLMSLLGGLSSFMGILLSLPRLMSSAEVVGNGNGTAEMLSASVYKASDYLWIMLLIITTVLLFVTLISIFSTLAHSVKEAGTLVMPLMMIVMLASFTSYGIGSDEIAKPVYLIPIYGTVVSFTKIFTFSADPVSITLAVCSNIIVSAIGVFVLTKLFDSEKVMFNE